MSESRFSAATTCWRCGGSTLSVFTSDADEVLRCTLCGTESRRARPLAHDVVGRRTIAAGVRESFTGGATGRRLLKFGWGDANRDGSWPEERWCEIEFELQGSPTSRVGFRLELAPPDETEPEANVGVFASEHFLGNVPAAVSAPAGVTGLFPLDVDQCAGVFSLVLHFDGARRISGLVVEEFAQEALAKRGSVALQVAGWQPDC